MSKLTSLPVRTPAPAPAPKKTRKHKKHEPSKRS